MDNFEENEKEVEGQDTNTMMKCSVQQILKLMSTTEVYDCLNIMFLNYLSYLPSLSE